MRVPLRAIGGTLTINPLLHAPTPQIEGLHGSRDTTGSMTGSSDTFATLGIAFQTTTSAAPPTPSGLQSQLWKFQPEVRDIVNTLDKSEIQRQVYKAIYPLRSTYIIILNIQWHVPWTPP